MRAIVIRNLKLYFRDKTTVFFSVLSSLIVLGLYFLFLGKSLASNMGGIPNAQGLVDTWVIAGILSITSVTTSLSVLGIKIQDEDLKISKDFHSAPVKKSSLVLGHILSASIVSLIMTVITFIISELFMYLRGVELLSIRAMLLLIPLMMITVLSNVAMMFFVISSIKTVRQLSVMGSLFGTFIGFITGMYIPIGDLPDFAQTIVKIFPVSHSVALFRTIMLSDFVGYDHVKHLDGIKYPLGLAYQFGSFEMTSMMSLAVVVISGVIFSILGLKKFKAKN